ncbi:MAG: hypothetical protein FJW95_11460 [Actinobacteria bacterium]|nr:hypothetical protein [Actinomycetota bacterium]
MGDGRVKAVRRWGRVAVVAVMVASAAVTVGPAGGSPATAGTTPSAWDPRIADLALMVERLRGLPFERPVPVRILGDAAFERRLLGDEEPTRKDRERWDETQDAFIAMGLLDERIPFDDARAAGGSNVAGFYDSERVAIVVRGSTLEDPSTRVTLVHELTHALQDQHFDLQAIQRRGAKADSMMTRALVEGDASAVEQQYFTDLGADERRAATASVADSLAEAAALPPFLEAIFYAPYLMGAVRLPVPPRGPRRVRGAGDRVHRARDHLGGPVASVEPIGGQRPAECLAIYLNQIRWYSRLWGCRSSATRAPSKSSEMIWGKPRMLVPHARTRNTTWSTAPVTATV